VTRRPDPSAIAVRHNPEASRFEAVVEGRLCVADYALIDGVLWMTHTGVPAAIAGRGIAGALVKEALAWADAQGLTVHPACSYVSAWMRRHPPGADGVRE